MLGSGSTSSPSGRGLEPRARNGGYSSARASRCARHDSPRSTRRSPRVSKHRLFDWLAQLRDRWLNPKGASEAELKARTLTNLYNQRPAWLAEAHCILDDAVLDAYGWPHDLSRDAILERLLALNLTRHPAA